MRKGSITAVSQASGINQTDIRVRSALPGGYARIRSICAGLTKFFNKRLKAPGELVNPAPDFEELTVLFRCNFALSIAYSGQGLEVEQKVC